MYGLNRSFNYVILFKFGQGFCKKKPVAKIYPIKTLLAGITKRNLLNDEHNWNILKNSP
jgi:hypothetical protein